MSRRIDFLLELLAPEDKHCATFCRETFLKKFRLFWLTPEMEDVVRESFKAKCNRLKEKIEPFLSLDSGLDRMPILISVLAQLKKESLRPFIYHKTPYTNEEQLEFLVKLIMVPEEDCPESVYHTLVLDIQETVKKFDLSWLLIEEMQDGLQHALLLKELDSFQSRMDSVLSQELSFAPPQTGQLQYDKMLVDRSYTHLIPEAVRDIVERRLQALTSVLEDFSVLMTAQIDFLLYLLAPENKERRDFYRECFLAKLDLSWLTPEMEDELTASFDQALKRFNSFLMLSETSVERANSLFFALAALKKERAGNSCAYPSAPAAENWQLELFMKFASLSYDNGKDGDVDENELAAGERLKEILESYDLSWLTPEMDEEIKRYILLRANAEPLAKTETDKEFLVRRLRAVKSVLDDFAVLTAK